MRETRVRSLGWEDLLEKKMAIHSSTIAWKIPWTEEPVRLQSIGLQRVRHDWATSLYFTSLHFTSLQIQFTYDLNTVYVWFKYSLWDQTVNICWLIEKARKFQKNIYFCFIDYAKAFDCVDHNKLWKILTEMGIPDHLPASWEIRLQVKKQQLELDMEKQTGSKSGKK